MEKRGSAGAITRAYMDGLLVEMRHLDAVLPSTQCELFGKAFSTPVTTGALSHLSGTHPGGMAEMARGARAANAVMFCGMGSEAELEDILETGADTIKIIKPYADRSAIYRKIEHAQRMGALAVGIDIDHAFNLKTGYDSIEGMDMRPVTSLELEGFVRATSLPFVVKGVLSAQDARKCADAGARGLVVSHHNGRLDYAMPPVSMLKSIAEAARGQCALFVDCGLESGMDIFKALALGAHACSVGRPLMRLLAERGAEGVREGIAQLTRELKYAMAMTCSPDIRNIDPSLIHNA